MEFRLIYDGPLLGASKTNTRADHKHDIRRVFHRQLKRLWEVSPLLCELARSEFIIETLGGPRRISQTNVAKDLADKYTINGYRCLPLVSTDIDLSCKLDILFLRYDQPGATLIQSGDIDNRLKTLFDALRRPQNANEAIGTPGEGEDPLYCLLEDDKLIDHVSVSTDLLLEPGRTVNDVHLVIDVRIKPVVATMLNIPFGI